MSATANSPDASARAAAEALIGWWALAGANWFIMDPPGAAAAPAVGPATHPIAGPVSAPLPPAAAAKAAALPPPDIPLPATLALLQAALAKTDSSTALPGTGYDRPVPPRGKAGARLMLLTDMPEAGDAATDRLLSGREGALLAAMLRAAGLAADGDDDGHYIASLAASRPASGRIPNRDLPALARLAAHHIALVQPTALLIVGSAVSEALFGAIPPPPTGRLPLFNQQGDRLGIAIRHPRTLSQRWQDKAECWQRLLTLARDCPFP